MGYLPYNIYLKTVPWIIVMIYLFLIATYFLVNSLKQPEELKSRKQVLRAIALFFYFYIVKRFFFILSDFERDANGDTQLFYRYTALAYVFYFLALLNFIFLTEKYVINRSKYILTYIFISGLIINIVMLFFPELMPIVRYLNYAILYTEVVILLIIYTYLAIKTTGKLRKKSIFIIIGLLVIVIAEFLESEALIMSGITTPYYSPIIFAIGATIFAYAQIKM
ncbi:MAG: hypothetical protein ACFFAO_10605 [Candidatus Hermodarchaeota archaeon]